MNIKLILTNYTLGLNSTTQCHVMRSLRQARGLRDHHNLPNAYMTLIDTVMKASMKLEFYGEQFLLRTCSSL